MRRNRGISINTKTSSTGGKIGLTVFGLIFGTIGLVVMLAALSGVRRQYAMRDWTPTRCVIESAAVQETGDKYRFTVSYRYEYAGREYAGDRYDAVRGASFERIAEKQRLLEAYPEGGEAQCFVNPDNPAEAVLVRDGPVLPAIGGALFASIFVLMGYGLAIGAWARSGKKKPAALSEGHGNERAGRLFVVLFCSVFIAVGVILPYHLFAKPLMRQQASRSWTPVEAVVTRSMVKSHSSDDGTTYSVYIAYRYEIDGRTFENDRYTFSSGSSSGHASKAAVVKRHPVGGSLTVYVNPDDPRDSVILREMGASLYLGLLPLLFAVFGLLFLVVALRSSRSMGAFHSSRGNPKRRRIGADKALPAIKRAQSRFSRLIVTILVALFWNGIVSVFLFQVVQEWSKGRRPIFLTLFLTPFVLIGLAMIGGVVHAFLQLFNPSVRLEPFSDVLHPGASPTLRFHLLGNVHKIRSLTVELIGREEARYRQGTSTSTDTHEFHRALLLETEDPRQMIQGDVVVAIPAGTMHSFSATNNKILWALKIKGKIPFWPDVSEEYILNVTPRETTP